MEAVHTLPFSYQGENYFLLVRTRQEGSNKTTYRVTPITAGESKIYGTFVFSREFQTFEILSKPESIGGDIVKVLLSTLTRHFNSFLN
jgi:hypothetical protein